MLNLPRKCPTTGEHCEIYYEVQQNALNGVGSLDHDRYVADVNTLARDMPCGEIGVDDEGPIEPRCAALTMAVVLSFDSPE